MNYLTQLINSMISSGGGCIARSNSHTSSHQIVVLFLNPSKPRFLLLRKHSSTVGAPSSSSPTAIPSANNTTRPLIKRHGPGDKVITLNVGGKQFQTLRSTISQNKVLYDHVLRAEANAEYAGANSSSVSNSVFIDRDPKHFDLILAYLRNKADGLVGSSDAAADTTSQILKFGRKQSTSSSSSAPASFKYTTSIQLPNDSKILSEMHLESLHYQIPEMVDLICSRQMLTRIFNLFGSNNPFQLAGLAFANMKRLLVVFGGVMTGVGGWVYAQAVVAQANCGSSGGGSDVSENIAEIWKNQSKLWSDAAYKWNGLLKNDSKEDRKEDSKQSKKK
jgi:hypothetical protein